MAEKIAGFEVGTDADGILLTLEGEAGSRIRLSLDPSQAAQLLAALIGRTPHAQVQPISPSLLTAGRNFVPQGMQLKPLRQGEFQFVFYLDVDGRRVSLPLTVLQTDLAALGFALVPVANSPG